MQKIVVILIGFFTLFLMNVNSVRAAEIPDVSFPTVSIKATPESVKSGESSKVSWSSTGATECRITGLYIEGVETVVGTSGLIAVGPLSEDRTIPIYCLGDKGQSETASVVIKVEAEGEGGGDGGKAVIDTLTATPAEILPGESSTIQWAATNASSCFALSPNSWTVSTAVTGTKEVSPIETTNYSMYCTGPGGNSADKSVTVKIGSENLAVSFSANPTSVASGSTSTLYWTSQNTSKCEASGDLGWSGQIGLSGSQVTDPLLRTTTFSITCTGPDGETSTKTATVNIESDEPDKAASDLIPCTNDCDFNDFMTLINNVVNFILFQLAVPIAAIMFAYAGGLLMFSGGETSKRSQAKKIFTNVAIGLVIAAAAWLIIHSIFSLLGYDGSWIGF